MEIFFVNKKNIICGILYRQHNSPERFQQYFDETIGKFVSSGKHVVIMGDFNIDLLKCHTSSYSHDFLSSLQSCYLIPAIDKPTRVCQTSATLIDNIFLNNPDQVVSCRNITSDISDHFSQCCIFKCMKETIKVKKKVKLRDLTFVPATTGACDVDNLFSSFYNKFNKIVNKYAPLKASLNEK